MNNIRHHGKSKMIRIIESINNNNNNNNNNK